MGNSLQTLTHSFRWGAGYDKNIDSYLSKGNDINALHAYSNNCGAKWKTHTEFIGEEEPMVQKTAYWFDAAMGYEQIYFSTQVTGAIDVHWTLLHCAAAMGSQDAINYLLSKGANKEIKDELGHTPSDVAKIMGHIVTI